MYVRPTGYDRQKHFRLSIDNAEKQQNLQVSVFQQPTHLLMGAQKRHKKRESACRAEYYSALRREQERSGGDDPMALLMDAARRKDEKFLAFLAREIGINYAEDGKSALFWIAGDGDLGAAAQLVHAGAKTNAVVEGAASPLMHAAFRNQLDMARLLLRHGARASYTDANGDSALSIAEAQGYAEMAALLRSAIHQDF